MKDKAKTITILGSTGSVGRQVLSVIDKYPGKFKVVGLSGYSNEKLLREQIEKYSPTRYYFPAGGVEIQTSVFDFLDDDKFESRCTKSLEELADYPADITVSAVSGIAGLWPAVAVLKRGGTLALANKETIVCAGRHLKELEKKYGGKILPLDTEHSAIMQCLKGESGYEISSVVLTASGGALRDIPIDKLAKVTPKEALAHPIWKMGKKITIDSATLFNKGLEVIEAMFLFNLPYNKVKVLMHRESVIHGMAEFTDGSVKALLSVPDISLAIETALFYPNKGNASVSPLNLASYGTLTFDLPDFNRYPCLHLAIKAAKEGEGVKIALSVADEVAVEAYLNGEIKYGDIPVILSKVFEKFRKVGDVALEDIFDVDSKARKYAFSLIHK